MTNSADASHRESITGAVARALEKGIASALATIIEASRPDAVLVEGPPTPKTCCR